MSERLTDEEIEHFIGLDDGRPTGIDDNGAPLPAAELPVSILAREVRDLRARLAAHPEGERVRMPDVIAYMRGGLPRSASQCSGDS